MFGLRTWAPMASRGSTSTTVYCTANLCASRQLIVDKKKDYARERWRTLCKSANLQTPGPEGNVHAGLCLPLLRPLLLAARELCSTPTAQVHHIYAHNPAQELSHYCSHYCLLYTILSMYGVVTKQIFGISRSREFDKKYFPVRENLLLYSAQFSIKKIVK